MFKCVTETNEVLPNIVEERMKVLIEKTDKIEAKLDILEQEKFYLSIGIPREFDTKQDIDSEVDKCTELLQTLLKEVKFLGYSVQYGMSVSLN
jgi:hypothetical protein